MKENDIYKHFKGNLYRYIGVALGIKSQSKHVRQHREIKLIGTAKHHETLVDMNIYTCYGIHFIDSVETHVLYQNPENNILWARPVKDFFGYKEHNGERIKRFVLLQNKEVELTEEKDKIKPINVL